MVHHNSLFLSEPESNTTIAIDLVAGFIGDLDLLHALLIRIALFQLLDPDIVGGSRNTKELTHGFHREFASVGVDRPILRCASPSFRNSVWNFFSKVFSIS